MDGNCPCHQRGMELVRSNKSGSLRPFAGGTRVAERRGMVTALLLGLILFVASQFVVAMVSRALKRTRFWGLPALLFGALSIAAFVAAGGVAHPEHGGPPVIDFGPLPHYALAFAAMVYAFVALAAGSRARKQYLGQLDAAPPELAVAIVHDR